MNVTVVLGFAASSNSAAPGDNFAKAPSGLNGESSQVNSSNGDRAQEFNITNDETCNTVRSGSWKLSDTLTIRFAGLILPHQNTEVKLYGEGVTSIQGKFDAVVVPEGRLYDIGYDYDQPAVVAKNFRPNRPRRFPAAIRQICDRRRGGNVIAVTNRNDDGPGGLQGRRTTDRCLPRLGVPLQSELEIKNPYITIARQTAPGDGICISNHGVEFETEHIVIRHIRFRPGDTSGVEYDELSGKGAQAVSTIAPSVGGLMRRSRLTRRTTLPFSGAW